MGLWPISRGRGEMADAADLSNLSAHRETGGVELLKVGETCNGNPEPSPEALREGVETRRAAPKPHMGNGEGIVQTTNPHWRGGESRSGTKIRRPQGRVGSIPSARTIPAF